MRYLYDGSTIQLSHIGLPLEVGIRREVDLLQITLSLWSCEREVSGMLGRGKQSCYFNSQISFIKLQT